MFNLEGLTEAMQAATTLATTMDHIAATLDALLVESKTQSLLIREQTKIETMDQTKAYVTTLRAQVRGGY